MGMVMRIKECRRAAGLTQMDLATRMGVTQNCVSGWESEVILPRSRQIPDLARVLGCSINDLFVDDTTEKEETPCRIGA